MLELLENPYISWTLWTTLYIAIIVGVVFDLCGVLHLC